MSTFARLRTVLSFVRRDVVVSMAVGLALVAVGGCYKPNEQAGKPGGSSAKPAHSHDHDHPTTGPHKGSLIELGDEEYHAELLHDDAAHKVTIYLLDSKATGKATSSEAKIALNFVVDGKPQQFMLTAAPQADDTAGSASKFEAVDEALCTALDAPKSHGKLNVTIGGKQYSGALAAEGHDHGHKH